LQLIEDGADIIDIGGESTRPGHTPISAKEEMDRIIPVIQKIKEQVQIPISVDTYKGRTAAAAIEAGADIINDIWGGKNDPEVIEVAAKYQVPIILMHNRKNENYHDLLEDIVKD